MITTVVALILVIQFIGMTICTGQAVKVVEEGKKSHDHYRTAVHDVIGEYIEQASSCKR
ncbi:hypothetical protein GLYMA_13G371550v4 [Glycine max]|nr:hypothetical protein GYH30_038556 [Glycine max]KRH23554.2 hypothetical protein GLYMA_13G371550v4 [Glycine max]